MDKMETAVAGLRGVDASKARSDMSAACNTFILDVDAFMTLVLAQDTRTRKVWKDICWYWIKALAEVYTKGSYDRRNEQACYIAHHIGGALAEKYIPLPELPQDSFISTYVSEMGREHRTIQQSFSSLVYAWINHQATTKKESKTKDADKSVKAEYGERWYVLPMI